jgi:exosortase E/protease (VPEID-CTERM system)
MRHVGGLDRIAPFPAAGLSLAARLALTVLVLFAEKITLNFCVNFDGPFSTTRLGTLLNAAQLLGLRFFVSLAALLALFAYASGSEQLKQLNIEARGLPVRAPWLVLQLIAVLAMAPLLWFLGGERGAILPFPLAVLLLGMLGISAGLTLLTAMAPWGRWIEAARALGAPGLYALGAATVATGVIYWSEELWEPTAQLTFQLVRHLLLPIIPTLQADPATRVLGTDTFSVGIANVCSGLEGVGLMLAFCCAWLVCLRAEYVFPRALLLIPCGVLLIFVLNAVRIAALVLIGSSGYPQVAQYGFHSQAGWIAFNVAAGAIAVGSRHVPWLSRVGASELHGENRTAPYLLPLLAILAAGMCARALSGEFPTLDWLRLIAGAGMLLICWRRLGPLSWCFSWRGPLAGIGMFAIWVSAAQGLLPRETMPAALTVSPEWARNSWIAARLAASLLVVPIAEELAYRAYLLRRIVSADFEAVAFRVVGFWPLLVSSVVFGIAHGTMWLCGIVAGLVYGGVLIRTERMGEAVAAHATTNGLLAAYVLLMDHWEVW